MKMRVYQKILVAALVLMSVICIAAGSTANVSDADLMGFFESIERKGTNIVLTTHGGGGRFVYRINGSKRKVSDYGETIVLPENSELKIIERHLSLTFSPMSERDGRKGFHLSLKKDFRSMCGDLTTNYAYMVYLDEKPDSSGGEKGSAAPERNRAMVKSTGVPEKGAEKKCLKGLTLLPCEEDSK
ncbi:MAG: hypothetical protein K6G91_02225 [Kiritimatiellae bacterium]|nr:hypothetical protein [Kiritimatiellia bacterium]